MVMAKPLKKCAVVYTFAIVRTLIQVLHAA
jgi:hypothetical protein